MLTRRNGGGHLSVVVLSKPLGESRAELLYRRKRRVRISARISVQPIRHEVEHKNLSILP